MHNAKKSIFLIWHGHPTHKSKKVRVCIEPYDGKLEVYLVPSYSPELNPDEYRNCDLKAGVHSGVPTWTKDQLGKKAISHLRMLQKKPKRVQKYFEHHKIAYAA